MNFRSKHHRKRHPESAPARKSQQKGARSAGPARTIEGRLEKNSRGFGFLEDLYIPPERSKRFFHGDRLKAKVDSRGNIERLELIEHGFSELVGRYHRPLGVKKLGTIRFQRKQFEESVQARSGHEKAKNGDWVRAKIDFSSAQTPFGNIVEIYGTELPPRADIPLVAGELGLVEHHSEAAEKEAVTLESRISPGHREDLRKVPFITIDGADARDFDDAIFVERQGSEFKLWVAIADVSHFVTPGGSIDREAYARATSVYFPERAFHMLPRALSENLCSLRPGVDRMVFVAEIHFTARGESQKVKLHEAIIRSHRRATYEEIEVEHGKNQSNSNWEYAPHYALYDVLKKARERRGSIDLDLPETKIEVSSDGTPIRATKRARLDSHRLIEEFMVAANEAVSRWMIAKKLPFIFRIHEEPAEQSLLRFSDLAISMGAPLPPRRSKNTQAWVARVTEALKNHPIGQILQFELLRSLKQAVYSEVNAGHFGLASQAYTHFTSPIRRYPDLIVHRLLRAALHGQKPPLSRDRLSQMAEHCSFRERLATLAERQSAKLKAVRILLARLGDQIEGSVSGMSHRGLYVQFEDPCVEAFLPKDGLGSDHYEYYEEKRLYVARRAGRVIKLGDKILTQVVRASLEAREAEVALMNPLVGARHRSSH